MLIEKMECNNSRCKNWGKCNRVVSDMRHKCEETHDVTTGSTFACVYPPRWGIYYLDGLQWLNGNDFQGIEKMRCSVKRILYCTGAKKRARHQFLIAYPTNHKSLQECEIVWLNKKQTLKLTVAPPIVFDSLKSITQEGK